LAIDEKVNGKNHPMTAASYYNMAMLLKNLGKFEEALQYYKQAGGLLTKFYGAKHPQAIDCLRNVQELSSKLNKLM